MNRKLAKEIGLILKRNSVGSIMGLENPEDIGSSWILVNWREVVKEIGKLLLCNKFKEDKNVKNIRSIR